MPLVSLLTGKVDFSNLFLALDGKVYQTLEEARTAGAATLNYGNFITTVVDFVIIAFALFLLVRQVNKLRSIAAPKPESVKRRSISMPSDVPIVRQIFKDLEGFDT